MRRVIIDSRTDAQKPHAMTCTLPFFDYIIGLVHKNIPEKSLNTVSSLASFKVRIFVFALAIYADISFIYL